MEQKKQKIIVIKKSEGNKEQKSQPPKQTSQQDVPQLKENIFAPLIGKKVCIQAKGVFIEGEFVNCTRGFFILKNARITGSRKIAETEILYVNQNNVAHIHPEPISLIDNTTESTNLNKSS